MPSGLPLRPRTTSTNSSKLNSQKGSSRVPGSISSAHLAEGPMVLVVRIQQHDVPVLMLLQDLAQDQRHGAGLARAGRAQQSEMLAQKVVDRDAGRQAPVLMDAADPDLAGVRAGEDDLQILPIGMEDAVAEGGEGGDAALEAQAAAAFVDRGLAQKLKLDDPDLGLLGVLGGCRDGQAGNQAEDHAALAAHGDQLADLEAAGLLSAFAAALQQGDRLGPRDRDDPADPGLRGRGTTWPGAGGPSRRWGAGACRIRRRGRERRLSADGGRRPRSRGSGSRSRRVRGRFGPRERGHLRGRGLQPGIAGMRFVSRCAAGAGLRRGGRRLRRRSCGSGGRGRGCRGGGSRRPHHRPVRIGTGDRVGGGRWPARRGARRGGRFVGLARRRHRWGGRPPAAELVRLRLVLGEGRCWCLGGWPSVHRSSSAFFPARRPCSLRNSGGEGQNRLPRRYRA